MNDLLKQPAFLDAAGELVATVKFIADRGWAPATSSNFSVRLAENRMAISRSGVDKAQFRVEHVMVIDGTGRALAPPDAKPSAETLLHTVLYEDPAVNAVLHTHSPNGTVLSMRHAAQGAIRFSGFEILKGLAGHTTHETAEILPIFPNSQDMPALSREVAHYRRDHPSMHGFLIEGHGLYAWGRTLAEAKRHIETFEFLMECLLKMR